MLNARSRSPATKNAGCSIAALERLQPGPVPVGVAVAVDRPAQARPLELAHVDVEVRLAHPRRKRLGVDQPLQQRVAVRLVRRPGARRRVPADRVVEQAQEPAQVRFALSLRHALVLEVGLVEEPAPRFVNTSSITARNERSAIPNQGTDRAATALMRSGRVRAVLHTIGAPQSWPSSTTGSPGDSASAAPTMSATMWFIA
jgi:hypothetical protein